MSIFIVKQYQPEENYMGHPCAVFNNYEAAQEEAQDLNVRYGKNIVLDEKGNFLGIKSNTCEDDYHYYEVEEFVLDKSCTRMENETPSVCCIVKHNGSEKEFPLLSEGLAKASEYNNDVSVYLKHKDEDLELIFTLN